MTQKGVYIGDVYQDTPAAKHGLQKGDLITHFDGRSVTEQDELVRLVGKNILVTPWNLQSNAVGEARKN